MHCNCLQNFIHAIHLYRGRDANLYPSLSSATKSIPWDIPVVHNQMFHNKLCAWRHNMPLPTASLNIISCKYENRQKLQFTTEFAKTNNNNTNKINTVQFYQVCANTVKAKHSTAEYGRRLCLFCPSNKMTFDLLTLKVVSESRVTWATSTPILVFIGLSVLELGPMYATDRQMSDKSIT